MEKPRHGGKETWGGREEIWCGGGGEETWLKGRNLVGKKLEVGVGVERKKLGVGVRKPGVEGKKPGVGWRGRKTA